MSWHFRADGDSASELQDQLERSTPVLMAIGVTEQIELAIEAAVNVVKSGACGKGPYHAVLSGHARQGETDIHGNAISIAVHSNT